MYRSKAASNMWWYVLQLHFSIWNAKLFYETRQSLRLIHSSCFKSLWSDITYLHKSHHSFYFSILEGVSSVPQLLGHRDCFVFLWLTCRTDLILTLTNTHYCFLCSFSVEMAITITATQSEVAVTLANTRMLLLTSALQQKNVTCTVTLLASKEAIYLCLAVNRFLAAEPLVTPDQQHRAGKVWHAEAAAISQPLTN